MPLSLHVRYEEQDGSPVVGAAIKAYPLDLPLVFTADGSEADGSEFFAHTASDGTATLTLYWPSEVMTATHGWAVKFPDGTTWAGRVPEGVASVPDILAMHNSYGWRLASGAKGTAVVAVTGSPGLIWKGAWSSTAPYAPHEVVQYSGSAYVALVPTTNIAPDSDPAKWGLVAQAVGGGGASYPGVTGDGGTPGGLTVAGGIATGVPLPGTELAYAARTSNQSIATANQTPVLGTDITLTVAAGKKYAVEAYSRSIDEKTGSTVGDLVAADLVMDTTTTISEAVIVQGAAGSGHMLFMKSGTLTGDGSPHTFQLQITNETDFTFGAIVQASVQYPTYLRAIALS